jgi:hypothetical protein
MRFNFKALLAAAGVAALAFSPANAYEGGAAQTKSGSFIGASAGMPPPGIYMFNQVFTYQSNFAGPGTSSLPTFAGKHVGVQAAVDVQGFIFVPGWTFLGATYDALIVQPFVMQSVGDPVNLQASGAFNTYFVPVELTWKLGTSGFVTKAGLAFYAPTGTIQGPAGISNVGKPFFTFQPEFALSYLKDGWNLTAFLYEEFNTANTRDRYTNGDIFHLDFTATKTIGKWTFGPVGYYVAQVTDDKCPVGVCTATHPGVVSPTGVIIGNAQRFQVFALGGLVEYNFGAASFSVWATQEIMARASNRFALAATGEDFSLITRGSTVFATLSYRLWAPEEPPKPAMFRK